MIGGEIQGLGGGMMKTVAWVMKSQEEFEEEGNDDNQK
jgi:hypothetical protein